MFEIKLCTVDYVVTQSQKNLRDETFCGQGIRQNSQNYNTSKLIHDYPFCVVAGNRNKKSPSNQSLRHQTPQNTLYICTTKRDQNQMETEQYYPTYLGRSTGDVKS